MGRRYPGCLLARVLVNKYYALHRKYSRPTQPGKLDAAKQWLLKWEGAVFGGIVLSGLAAMAVKLYISERLDDIERRHERRTFYEGSCMMVGAHLAAVQNSLMFWEGLAAYSEFQGKQRQQWHQQQQRHMQLAQQRFDLWTARCTAVCGTTWQALQQQQQQKQKQGQLAVTGQQEGQQSLLQQQQQQQQEKEQQAQHILLSQLQQQEQQHGNEDSLEQLMLTEQQQQAAQQVEQQPIHELPPEAQQQQQQQQQLGSSWQQWNPACWLARRQAQLAQQRLWQQQQQLALEDVGLLLWQQLHTISQQQVHLLQLRQEQQQELLLSHAALLLDWQQLGTRVDQLVLGFYPPDPGRVYSQGYSMLKGLAADWLQPSEGQAGSQGSGSSSRSRSSSSSSSSSSAPGSQPQQQQLGSQSSGEQQQGKTSLVQRLLRLPRWFRRNSTQPAQQQVLSKEQQQQQPEEQAGQEAGSSRLHVSVRLLLPKWVDEIEDRDYVVVSKDASRGA